MPLDFQYNIWYEKLKAFSPLAFMIEIFAKILNAHFLKTCSKQVKKLNTVYLYKRTSRFIKKKLKYVTSKIFQNSFDC